MTDSNTAKMLYQKTGFIDRVSIDELDDSEKFAINAAFKKIPPVIYRCTRKDGTFEYLEPKQYKKKPKGTYLLAVAVNT